MSSKTAAPLGDESIRSIKGSLFDLPIELRDEIYDYALLQQRPNNWVIEPFKLPPLLFASKQVRAEVLAVMAAKSEAVRWMMVETMGRGRKTGRMRSAMRAGKTEEMLRMLRRPRAPENLTVNKTGDQYAEISGMSWLRVSGLSWPKGSEKVFPTTRSTSCSKGRLNIATTCPDRPARTNTEDNMFMQQLRREPSSCIDLSKDRSPHQRI